jgi:hypothetical protein
MRRRSRAQLRLLLAAALVATPLGARESPSTSGPALRDDRRVGVDPARATARDAQSRADGEARADAQTRGDAHGEALRDERARAALERGLDWLARAQERESDGSFPATGLAARDAGAMPATAGTGSFAPVAVTSLATLALLAGGSAPDRGPHGHAVAMAVDWLVTRTDLDARSETAGYVHLAGDTLSRMHGHGFAALALAQAFAMSPQTDRGARVQAALQAAVDCIQKSQGVDGGWWYEPKRAVQHENSITICAVQALRAAHSVGAHVDAQTIQRAIEYVSRTQKPDGSFRYALGEDKSSVALTAAAIATLNATGTYSGRTLEDGYDWIFRRLAAREDNVGAGGGGTDSADDFVMCPFYERLYLAQALWQNADERVFDDWWRAELPRVIASQGQDGSWRDPRYGDCYATAMNCLVLALPAGLLPIFQR